MWPKIIRFQKIRYVLVEGDLTDTVSCNGNWIKTISFNGDVFWLPKMSDRQSWELLWSQPPKTAVVVSEHRSKFDAEQAAQEYAIKDVKIFTRTSAGLRLTFNKISPQAQRTIVLLSQVYE